MRLLADRRSDQRGPEGRRNKARSGAKRNSGNTIALLYQAPEMGRRNWSGRSIMSARFPSPGLKLGIWNFPGAWSLGFGASVRRRRTVSRPRVKLPMDRLQPLLVHVRVHLGRRNIGVSQHFLDD